MSHTCILIKVCGARTYCAVLVPVTRLTQVLAEIHQPKYPGRNWQLRILYNLNAVRTSKWLPSKWCLRVLRSYYEIFNVNQWIKRKGGCYRSNLPQKCQSEMRFYTINYILIFLKLENIIAKKKFFFVAKHFSIKSSFKLFLISGKLAIFILIVGGCYSLAIKSLILLFPREKFLPSYNLNIWGN